VRLHAADEFLSFGPVVAVGVPRGERTIADRLQFVDLDPKVSVLVCTNKGVLGL
jgi:hypothetical protein